AVALVKSISMSDHLGLSIEVENDMTAELFSETQSRMIVSIQREHQKAFEAIVQDAKKIGYVTADPQFVVRHQQELIINESVKNLNELWRQTIPCILSENK